jgi:predicted ATPase
MLKRFYVDNFKTHINTTYELSPVNLLIGMNNSGKTNLCQAMRFVVLTSMLPLSKAAAMAATEEWTLANVYLDKSTIDFRIEADLTYQKENCSFVYELRLKLLDPVAAKEASSRIAVESELLTVSTSGFENAHLIVNDEGRVQLLHETHKSKGDEYQVATNAPVDATMLNRLYDLKDNPRANLFKKYLASWLYYDLDAQQLRRPEARMFDTVLNQDGSNLASVLFNLKNGNERLYRKLMEVTKSAIEPRLELLSFFKAAENQVFMVGEDSLGHRFGPWSMSNGTLRFIALAYIFLTQQSHPDVGGSRIVIVEEPETGLYVGHLKELFSLIDQSGNNGQFIFTSHSPYFIDLFDGLLNGVTVAKRGEKNTQLVRPDPKNLKRQLENMPLGEMHFREMMV